jgi:hypothetical protein
MHFHGNALATVQGLVDVVIAKQQGKRICMGHQHATAWRAVLSVLFAPIYERLVAGVFQLLFGELQTKQ